MEDWAETFASYLHILDASDTATARGIKITLGGDSTDRASGPCASSMTTLLARWQPVADAVNAVADALGAPTVYPFRAEGTVVDKLTFVRSRVTAGSTGARSTRPSQE